MIKRDYLEALIEQLTAAVERALGHVGSKRPDDARREIDAAYQQVGLSALVVDRLDAASVRMMAGDKVEALVHLLEADARVSSLLGDEARARRRAALCAALRRMVE
ncbi:MAG: hypothetical protein KIT84_18870 [Labilithrix sp.]|nr:hypothetical protein [Labilithrix sp.]MCW5813098.1 hypothetical protein [Labilithrix sp.]